MTYYSCKHRVSNSPCEACALERAENRTAKALERIADVLERLTRPTFMVKHDA